ncbi:MFS transporter [Thioalkalivibrio sp. ALJ7]|uniref:MFS transporter n=1 Tax=Thioalkalivibrio sp. ALJ7 TaxID=1158756 RepID=UPI000688671D|nr:MFS transporter [Thioalkalivibrio sp. ALJ7]
MPPPIRTSLYEVIALPRTQLFAYGGLGLPLAILGLPLYVFLPAHYAEHTGLSVTLVGVLLLLARLLDVITDPLVGYLSDRIPGAWRRRAVLLAGVPVLLVSAPLLFRPPAEAGALYLLGFASLVYLGWTLFTLPYTAWGAELSGDYHQRSRVTAAREGFVVLGTVIAAALPAVLGLEDDAGAALAALAVLLWVLMPPALFVLLWRVPERAGRLAPVPWRAGWALLANNRPFRRLVLAWVFNGTANAIPATLFLLFITHVLEAPEHAGPLLLVYFATGILALPLWLRLARHLPKHRVWTLSMLLASAFFIWVPFLGAGDILAFYAITVLTGLSLGVDLALPAAMQADVIDQDTADGGGERAGLFFGLWGMATKLALALAVGISFPLLGLAGFSTDGGNGSTALLALGLAYAGLPVLFKLAAMALVWRFPIDAATQHHLRERIQAREHARPSPAPGGPAS